MWGDLKLGQVPYILSFIPKFIYMILYNRKRINKNKFDVVVASGATGGYLFEKMTD